jgi:hypothetical protein
MVMDVVSRAITLDMRFGDPPVRDEDWLAMEPPFIQHKPTRTIFRIDPPSVDDMPDSFTRFDLTARLVHVCDGEEIPEGWNLIHLGVAAIIMALKHSGDWDESADQADAALSDDDIPF